MIVKRMKTDLIQHANPRIRTTEGMAPKILIVCPSMIETTSISRRLSSISSFASSSLSFLRLDATRSSKDMWRSTFLVIRDRGNWSNNDKRVKRLPSNKTKAEINHKTMLRMTNCTSAVFPSSLTINQECKRTVINKYSLMRYLSMSLEMAWITTMVLYNLMPI